MIPVAHQEQELSVVAVGDALQSGWIVDDQASVQAIAAMDVGVCMIPAAGCQTGEARVLFMCRLYQKVPVWSPVGTRYVKCEPGLMGHWVIPTGPSMWFMPVRAA